MSNTMNTPLHSDQLMEDPFVALDRKREELVTSGVTGISLFVSNNHDATDRDRAVSMLKMLNHLDDATDCMSLSV